MPSVPQLRAAAPPPAARAVPHALHAALQVLSNAAIRAGVTPTIVTLNPGSGGLPSSGAINGIANGLGWWALLLALLGLVLGAATWAVGAHSNNYQFSMTGRRAVVVSALAALVIGAAPELINFFFGAGKSLQG